MGKPYGGEIDSFPANSTVIYRYQTGEFAYNLQDAIASNDNRLLIYQSARF